MNYLRNVRVAWRLGLGFGLLLLLVAAVVATGATATTVQKRAMEQVVEVGVAKVRLLSEMLDANNQMMVVRREMLIRQGEERANDEQRIADLVKRYEASWTAYQALPGDAEGKVIGETIAAKRALARPLNKQTSELMEQGDFPAAVALTWARCRKRPMAGTRPWPMAWPMRKRKAARRLPRRSAWASAVCCSCLCWAAWPCWSASPRRC